MLDQITRLEEKVAELQTRVNKYEKCKPFDMFFTFHHPNGDELICHLEYDAGDPSEPERATLVNAYLQSVDVFGILSIELIDQIEAEALK
jgi:hypothetical protein